MNRIVYIRQYNDLMPNQRMGWNGSTRGNVFVYNTANLTRVQQDMKSSDTPISRMLDHMAYLPAYIEIVYE